MTDSIYPTAEIVGRIRKLLALAKDRGATEAEAASALEKANALLIAHNLSMDALGTDAPVETVTEDGIAVGQRLSWRTVLAAVLAEHNLCSSFQNYDQQVIVGRPTNIAATRAMFDWISPQLVRLAEHEYRAYQAAMQDAVTEQEDMKWCPTCERWRPDEFAFQDQGGDFDADDVDQSYYYDDEDGHTVCGYCEFPVYDSMRINGRTWKRSFMYGIVRRIEHRLILQRLAQESSDRPGEPLGAEVTALVARTGQEIEAYNATHHPDLISRPVRDPNFHAGAYGRGQTRGDDVSLGGSALRGGTSRIALNDGM